MDAYSEIIEQLKDELVLLKTRHDGLLNDQKKLENADDSFFDQDGLTKGQIDGTLYYFNAKLSELKHYKNKLENKKSFLTRQRLLAVGIFVAFSMPFMVSILLFDGVLEVGIGMIFIGGVASSVLYLAQTDYIRTLSKNHTVKDLDEEIARLEESIKIKKTLQEERDKEIQKVIAAREAVNELIDRKKRELRIIVEEKRRLTNELMASQIDQAILDGKAFPPKEFVRSKSAFNG